MARLFRWLLRIFTGLVALAAVALIGVYYLAARSLPDYDATHGVTGASAPVEIVRDNHAIPHIFGESDADTFFGLGYAHAQDRLWQMTMLRRAAQGRLSELFGTRTLATDKLMRRLDLYGLARRSVAAQDAQTRAALEAYAAGVNARIRDINDEALGRGAPEFFLYGPDIAFWQPADSIAIVKLMALRLSSHLQDEVLRARVSLELPEARVRDILPEVPGPGLAALPDYAALFPDDAEFRTAAAGPLAPAPLSPVTRRTLSGASNVWAAGPSRSASGKTLLANDPHLGFTAPSIWYLARLQLRSGGVIGATIPGVPAVLSGRNPALAWGITASYLDDQDLFIERLAEGEDGAYRTPGGTKRFVTRRSIIRVAGHEPVTITLRWTDNGPVLPGDHFGLARIVPEGHVAALGWTALDPADTSLTAAVRLMHAQSVEDGIAAGKAFVAPSLNLMLADGKHIAMQMIGAMPRRDPHHRSKGRLPTPGWQPENRWQGVFDYSVNPRFTDPAGGLLGNTNNKIVDRPFPRHVSYDWGDTQRIQRWRRLMQSREVHSRRSFMEAQLDTVSFTARALLSLIGRDLWFTSKTAPEGTEARRRARALKLLREWNGDMSEHLPEPLIYAAWMRELQQRLIRDELGPLAAEFRRPVPLFLERVFRDTDGAAIWCDVVQSDPRETCTEIAREALDDALVWISETYGSDLTSLRWGDAHMALHKHPVLGEVPVLSWLVNIRQSISGGDNTLARAATRARPPDPMTSVQGAGYRGVYDFADPDSSVFVLATGESGHPLSAHYSDLGRLWRRGEYVPMSLDRELAEAASLGTTRLVPREGDGG